MDGLNVACEEEDPLEAEGRGLDTEGKVSALSD